MIEAIEPPNSIDTISMPLTLTSSESASFLVEDMLLRGRSISPAGPSALCRGDRSDGYSARGVARICFTYGPSRTPHQNSQDSSRSGSGLDHCLRDPRDHEVHLGLRIHSAVTIRPAPRHNRGPYRQHPQLQDSRRIRHREAAPNAVSVCSAGSSRTAMIIRPGTGTFSPCSVDSAPSLAFPRNTCGTAQAQQSGLGGHRSAPT